MAAQAERRTELGDVALAHRAAWHDAPHRPHAHGARRMALRGTTHLMGGTALGPAWHNPMHACRAPPPVVAALHPDSQAGASLPGSQWPATRARLRRNQNLQ